MNRSVGIGTIKNTSQSSRRKNTNSVSETPLVKFESEYCASSGHLCRREKLQGHEFCLKHILVLFLSITFELERKSILSKFVKKVSFFVLLGRITSCV